jgi:hypothetical protein
MAQGLRHRICMAVTLAGVTVLAASCQGLGGLGTAACPQLRGGVDALSASYSANAQANAKVRAFVQASKEDIDTVVRIGQQLPRVVGQAGARALACIAAATDASVSASISVKVTVQASAGVSGRVGG